MTVYLGVWSDGCKLRVKLEKLYKFWTALGTLAYLMYIAVKDNSTVLYNSTHRNKQTTQRYIIFYK